MNEEKCYMCLEKINDNGTKLECNHTYHNTCLENLRKKSEICPECNVKSDKQVTNLTNDKLDNNIYDTLPASFSDLTEINFGNITD